MHPVLQNYINDYNHALSFFNNVNTNDNLYRIDAAIYNLTAAEQNLYAAINKYSSKEYTNFQFRWG